MSKKTKKDRHVLTPTEDLVMEVLGARFRLGESAWTFDKRHTPAVKKLESYGYLHWKSGVMPKTILVFITDLGKKRTLSKSYKPPTQVAVAEEVTVQWLIDTLTKSLADYRELPDDAKPRLPVYPR